MSEHSVPISPHSTQQGSPSLLRSHSQHNKYPAAITQAINFVESLSIGYCHRKIQYVETNKNSKQIDMQIPIENLEGIAVSLENNSVLLRCVLQQLSNLGIEPIILGHDLKILTTATTVSSTSSPGGGGFHSAAPIKTIPSCRFLLVDESVSEAKITSFKKTMQRTNIILICKTNSAQLLGEQKSNLYDKVLSSGQLFLLEKLLLE